MVDDTLTRPDFYYSMYQGKLDNSEYFVCLKLSAIHLFMRWNYTSLLVNN